MSKRTTAFFICLGDMPLVNKDIYNLLIESKNRKEIIVPSYEGKQRNPVLFLISMKEKIMSIQGDAGAKKILELNKDKITYVQIDDISIVKDFNTKENFNFWNI